MGGDNGRTALRLLLSVSRALEGGQEGQLLGVSPHARERKKTGMRRLALPNHRGLSARRLGEL